MGRSIRLFRSPADTLILRRGVLRSRGVPRAFIEEIATRAESPLTFGRGLVVALPIVVLLSLGLLAVFARLFIAPVEAAARAASAQQAWLFGMGNATTMISAITSLALMLSIVSTAGWVVSFFYAPRKPYPGPCLAASVLREAREDEYGQTDDGGMTRLVARCADAKTADELLAKFARLKVRSRSVWAFAIAGVYAIGLWALWTGYWIATPTGVVQHGLLGERFHAWPTATAIVTGCEQSDARSDLIYDVEFGGWTAHLARINFESPKGAALIDRLSEIDKLMRSQATKRRLAVSKTGSPVDPRCVATWERLAPGGEAALMTLLGAP